MTILSIKLPETFTAGVKEVKSTLGSVKRALIYGFCTASLVAMLAACGGGASTPTASTSPTASNPPSSITSSIQNSYSSTTSTGVKTLTTVDNSAKTQTVTVSPPSDVVGPTTSLTGPIVPTTPARIVSPPGIYPGQSLATGGNDTGLPTTITSLSVDGMTLTETSEDSLGRSITITQKDGITTEVIAPLVALPNFRNTALTGVPSTVDTLGVETLEMAPGDIAAIRIPAPFIAEPSTNITTSVMLSFTTDNPDNAGQLAHLSTFLFNGISSKTDLTADYGAGINVALERVATTDNSVQFRLRSTETSSGTPIETLPVPAASLDLSTLETPAALSGPQILTVLLSAKNAITKDVAIATMPIKIKLR